MSGNKYDNLDKFFQSRLKDSGSTEQWNTPPRGVLDDAFTRLDRARDKRRKSLFFLIGTGLFIVLIALVFVLTNNKINSIDRKVDQLNSQKNTISNKVPASSRISEASIHEGLSEMPESNSSKDRISQGYGPDRQNHASETISDEQRKEGNSDTSDQSSSPEALRGIASLHSDVRDNRAQSSVSSLHTTADRKVSNSVTDRNATAYNTGHADDQIQSIELIDAELESTGAPSLVNAQMGHARVDIPTRMLDARAIQPLIMERELKRGIPIAEHAQSKSKANRVSSHLVFGHSLSSFKMTGTEALDYSLTGYDRHYSGFHAGVGINYELNRSLSLDGNATIKILNNRSVYEKILSYDKSNETIDGSGQVYYRSQIAMESPMGEFFNDAEFSLDGQEIQDDDNMDNVTSIHQRLNIVSVSTGLDYALFKKGRLGIHVGGGPGINYLFGLDQNMNTKLFYHGMMMMDDSYQITRDNEINTVFMTVYGKVGLQYTLSDRLSIRLNGGFERSLSAIRRSVSVPVSTYLKSYQSSVIVGYTF